MSLADRIRSLLAGHAPSRIGVAGILAAVAVAGGRPTFGGVVSDTQIVFGPTSYDDAEYRAIVQKGPNNTAPGNDTLAWFKFDGVTLQVGDMTADEGSDWYMVGAGDVFSAATIAGGQFPALTAGGGGPGPSVYIPLGDFYVGVNTGKIATIGDPDRDVFGSLELNNTGTELVPVANAVDYGDGGIIVGTTTPAPEPASLLLLAGGLGLLAIRRRRFVAEDSHGGRAERGLTGGSGRTNVNGLLCRGFVVSAAEGTGACLRRVAGSWPNRGARRIGWGLSVMVCLGGMPVGASGGVIPGAYITFGSDNFPGANYGGGIVQTPRNGDSTEVFFNYAGTTLAVVNSELDEGSDWYLAKPGDLLSAQTIAGGNFTTIVAGTFLPPVSIPLGDFYLGIATTDPTVPAPPSRNVFGWLELNNTGTELIAVANAVDYGDGGIIVGTTTPAPEPASLLLLAGGLGLLAIQRRRR